MNISEAILSEKFRKFIPVLLEHEGGFVDDPDDAGGATKYGISTRFLVGKRIDLDHDGDVDKDDVIYMQLADAVDIYYHYFWHPYHYSLVYNEALSFRLFDFAVNAGATRCAIVLTEALLNVGLTWPGQEIAIPMNVIEDINAYPDQAHLYEQFKVELREFYIYVSKKRNNAKYLKGWLAHRVEHNPFER